MREALARRLGLPGGARRQRDEKRRAEAQGRDLVRKGEKAKPGERPSRSGGPEANPGGDVWL